MSIDWSKVEQKPDKEIKVTGKLLIDFRNRVEDQEKEISSLNEKVDALTKTKSENEARINELQDKVVVDLQSRLADQEKESSSLQADVDKLSKIKDENDAMINDLQEKVANLENTIKDRDANIEENTSTIATLNGKIDGLQASLDTTINEKDRQIKELMEEKNAMKTELDEIIRGLESNKSTLEESEASLKNQLEEMDANYKNNIEGIESEFKNQTSELEARCDLLEQEKFALQKEKDDVSSKLQFMDEQLKAKDFEYFKKLSKERAERASNAYKQKKIN